MRVDFNSGNKGTFNPLAPNGSPIASTHQEIVQEAIVVDVIVNDSHPHYAKDGYNVGAIKFRSLKGDMFRDESQLHWALPLEANISGYPLLNEIVFIYSALNRFYYTPKVNVSSKVTSHGMVGLNEEMEPTISQTARSAEYRSFTSEKKEVGNNKPLGKKFQDQPVHRLRHDEGDILFEGRFGQSIRFGASWLSDGNFKSSTTNQSPNMLFRVGPDQTQTPTTENGLIVEDINLDGSSIYMVEDQVVPLEFASKDASNHMASVETFPPTLDGKQIVINTDRLVFNTRTGKMIGSSKDGIHWSTNLDFTVDADQDYKSSITRDAYLKIGNIFQINAVKRASVIAPKVYVGLEEKDEQPIACGDLLAEFLEKFINVFISNASGIALPTGGPGAPSPLNPKIISQLKQLQADVAKKSKASFNSTVAYTTK